MVWKYYICGSSSRQLGTIFDFHVGNENYCIWESLDGNLRGKMSIRNAPARRLLDICKDFDVEYDVICWMSPREAVKL